MQPPVSTVALHIKKPELNRTTIISADIAAREPGYEGVLDISAGMTQGT
jgi:hypothetical protein